MNGTIDPSLPGEPLPGLEKPGSPGSEPAAEHFGQLHVTRQCCGAATCRNIAPELLGEVAPSHTLRDDVDSKPPGPKVLPGSYDEGAYTGVLRHPQNLQEYKLARTAAASCPFGAIRLSRPSAGLPKGEPGPPWKDWPRQLEDNVWVVGIPSKDSICALPYFIELPGGGILIDVPQPNEELFRWLTAHGGVKYMFLTHRDHVQHHAEFAKRFPNCRRILGAADVNHRANKYAHATTDVEIKLSGSGPMTLEGEPIPEEALADAEFAVLPQPGHTAGSMCLLYRGKFFFTGDHLHHSRNLGRMVAHRLQCWEDWERQIRSVTRLLEWAEAGRLRFSWLLPGHGEWHRLEGEASFTHTAAALRRSLEWLNRQPPGHVPRFRFIPFAISRSEPRTRFARFVRAIGQDGGETWLLPKVARRYVNDYNPDKTRNAVRRAYALGGGALVLLASGIGLVAYGVMSLLTRS